jgi:hypothetical protein
VITSHKTLKFETDQPQSPRQALEIARFAVERFRQPQSEITHDKSRHKTAQVELTQNSAKAECQKNVQQK